MLNPRTGGPGSRGVCLYCIDTPIPGLSAAEETLFGKEEQLFVLSTPATSPNVPGFVLAVQERRRTRSPTCPLQVARFHGDGRRESASPRDCRCQLRSETPARKPELDLSHRSLNRELLPDRSVRSRKSGLAHHPARHTAFPLQTYDCKRPGLIITTRHCRPLQDGVSHA